MMDAATFASCSAALNETILGGVLCGIFCLVCLLTRS